MTMSKKVLSALEMQRQLGHKRYEPIWYILHKKHKAMGQRDNSYQLSGILELDEGYHRKGNKHKPQPRRGQVLSQNRILLYSESTTLQDIES
jgi:hypothetical protein